MLNDSLFSVIVTLVLSLVNYKVKWHSGCRSWQFPCYVNPDRCCLHYCAGKAENFLLLLVSSLKQTLHRSSIRLFLSYCALPFATLCCVYYLSMCSLLIDILVSSRWDVNMYSDCLCHTFSTVWLVSFLCTLKLHNLRSCKVTFNLEYCKSGGGCIV